MGGLESRYFSPRVGQRFGKVNMAKKELPPFGQGTAGPTSETGQPVHQSISTRRGKRSMPPAPLDANSMNATGFGVGGGLGPGDLSVCLIDPDGSGRIGGQWESSRSTPLSRSLFVLRRLIGSQSRARLPLRSAVRLAYLRRPCLVGAATMAP